MKFRVKTTAPNGRSLRELEMAAKVQVNLFDTVAMIVAASPDAEKQLMTAIADAKAGKLPLPVAV